MLLLKIIVIFQVLVNIKVFAANKNNDIKGSDELIKEFVEPKTRKLSKTEKLFRSPKLAKSEKKQSKNMNLSKLNTKKVDSSFLNSNIRMIFNHLWLTFTNAPIL